MDHLQQQRSACSGRNPHLEEWRWDGQKKETRNHMGKKVKEKHNKKKFTNYRKLLKRINRVQK